MWAGPTQINGPASAQKKGWADLGPTKNSSLVWARPDPDVQGWASIGLAQRQKPSGGRIIFSSLPSACRTILHAGGDACNKRKCRREESVPGVEEAVAGGAAVEAGGDVVAHGRRLQAALRLFTAVRFVLSVRCFFVF